MGKALEPAIAPMDWDWRVGIGLIGSFAAREVIVSTLVQVYAFSGDEGDVSGLGEVLTKPDSVTGKPPLSLASAMALLVFFVFALQCVSTIVVIARETASWKWAIFALVYQTSFAWLTAWICYLVFA
jgi:ferrous iron transport protein B